MSTDSSLLFTTEPKRFMELVANDDPEARRSGCANVVDFVLCEIVRYGCFNRDDMIAPLAALYRTLVLKMTEDQRLGIFTHVKTMIEQVSFVSVNALLPFIAEDESRQIVSTAVIDYVSLGSLNDDDPMSRVKDIIGMIGNGVIRNEGAAFGGLLHIGDPRVCRLLIALRDSLDHAAINEAVKCATGLIHAATTDFYMDWLEGMVGDGQDDVFGAVASGLVLLKRQSRTDQVATGQRPFPVTGVSAEEWTRMAKLIPLAEYVDRAAPRMIALERSEPPPRVMPHVLAAWGLRGVTDPAETPPVDDRTSMPAGAAGRSGSIDGAGIVDVKQEWWDGEGQIYFVWGLLNPNGPTLYGLGDREVEGGQRIFMRRLHMFGGGTTYAPEAAGPVSYRRIYDDAVQIDEHLLDADQAGLFQVIPSFVIANGGDESLGKIARQLLREGAAAQEDWGRHMAWQRRFGSDFFARAGAEMREYYETAKAAARSAGEGEPEFLQMIQLRYGHLPQFKDASIPSWSPSPITPELLEEWWQLVSARDYNVEALTALKTMWEGAASMVSAEQGVVVRWEAVIGFLGRFNLSLD